MGDLFFFSFFFSLQAIANVGSENNGSVSQVSLKEQDTSYVPWSHNGHDDPYGLISCAQSSAQSR